MSQQHSPCQCEAIAELASDRNCPIEFDANLNEYNIVSKDAHVRYRLYFCFFCGGSLPESERVNLYTQPSQKEIEQIKKLLGEARTIEEALRKLGQPSKATNPPRTEQQYRSGIAYRQHYHYLTRWKTLDLTVRERSDQSFDLAIVGKCKGPQNHSKRHKKG